MSGNGDGEERWSKDDLFDLHSALSFGVRIEEIAFFLGGTKSKTFLECNRRNSAKAGLTASNSLRVQFDRRPADSSEARKPLSAGGEIQPDRSPASPRRSDRRGNAPQITD